MNGDLLAVGNRLLNVGQNEAQGGVYIFSRSGSVWTQLQKLTASDGVASGLFGGGLFISPSLLIVGASGNYPDISGAVYVFVRESEWTQHQKLQVVSKNAWNSFGNSLSYSGNSLIVSCGRYSGTSLYTGSAFIFTHPATASMSVSGRVVSPGGLGVKGAMVTMIYVGGESRRMATSSLGYYTFDDLAEGPYMISVSSRRYRFEPKSLMVSQDLTNVDFVGLE